MSLRRFLVLALSLLCGLALLTGCPKDVDPEQVTPEPPAVETAEAPAPAA